MNTCPFCSIAVTSIIASNSLSIAMRDAYPVSKGHTLVFPRRHISALGDATDSEYCAIWSLVSDVLGDLRQEFHPDGFNVGINDGIAAGQTVPHLHAHIIPRYLGDQKDPRGGVRWVIPEKADYWSDKKI